MTVDIGCHFRSAQAALITWVHDDVRDALDLLAGDDLRIEWEPGDEEWGRILDSRGNVCALVCARVPLGIASEHMDPERLTKRLSWITVSSMSEKLFEVDRTVLEQVFTRPMSTSLDYSRLSANDLWWATVS